MWLTDSEEEVSLASVRKKTVAGVQPGSSLGERKSTDESRWEPKRAGTDGASFVCARGKWPGDSRWLLLFETRRRTGTWSRHECWSSIAASEGCTTRCKGISLKEFDALSFDMILMSPPCQPFTRIGRQGDTSDPRTRSFLYILDLLPRLAKRPKYLLLENVKGFESSSARDELIQTLEKCGFTYQEFLLSPTCLGIPNSRLRYFLIARPQSKPFTFHVPGKILTDFPSQDPVDLKTPGYLTENGCLVPTQKPPTDSDDHGRQHPHKGDFLFKLETVEELERKQRRDNDLSVQMLKSFLQDDVEDISPYFVQPKSLLRYAFLLDIVTPTCRRSTCFTKGYGHYIEGTGSVLQTAEDIQLESVFKSFEVLSEDEKLKKLSTLKLRYFTPKEIANLHGFPPEFGFPDNVTTKQRYRLLGNSLNIHVVAKLISVLVE